MGLIDIRKELLLYFSLLAKTGGAYVSEISANQNASQKECARLWLNARCGGTVVGVDFTDENGYVVVSIFFRAIQNVRIASHFVPIKRGTWDSAYGKHSFGFKVESYPSRRDDNYRMVRKWNKNKHIAATVVRNTIAFLDSMGPIA